MHACRYKMVLLSCQVAFSTQAVANDGVAKSCSNLTISGRTKLATGCSWKSLLGKSNTWIRNKAFEHAGILDCQSFLLSRRLPF